MRLSYDIFCRVIDNYGDIGVCWRLARQLAQRPDCKAVRLWVDDLKTFSRIAPRVQASLARQTVEAVHIRHWHDHDRLPAGSPTQQPLAPEACSPADVVIEAFACSPPAAYLGQMSDRNLWINLEYLSAEAWVASCHGLPSLQANGLRKFFFFPGFSESTGGLLREPGLLSRRDAWLADPDARPALLERLGVDATWLDRLRHGARLVYVYCYPQAPLPALLHALSAAGRDTLVLLPEGIWPGALPGPVVTERCRVQLHTHSFVDQDTFDRLLWSSDLNIVRGEDSLVRALWAGRPMIWQPYLQEEDAHLDKLAAWLAASPFDQEVQGAMMAWNRGDAHAVGATLVPLLKGNGLKTWCEQTRDWCSRLAAYDDLATRLVSFCAETSQTR